MVQSLVRYKRGYVAFNREVVRQDVPAGWRVRRGWQHLEGQPYGIRALALSGLVLVRYSGIQFVDIIEICVAIVLCVSFHMPYSHNQPYTRAAVICSSEPDAVAVSSQQLANRMLQPSVLQERPAWTLRSVADRENLGR
jgi:hypothetical protein